MREDNAELNQTVTYTYDKGGNITEKTVYPFTTGTVGTATDTIAYTYDSTWKDKLVSYDGTTVSYDEIGNPDVYTHDRVFIWSARDLLYAYLEDGGFAEYRYNENGLRSLKIIYDENRYDVDGYYYYFWSDDGRLLAYTVDQTGSEDPYSVLVLYNSDKEPIGFTVEDDTYYYLKNIQGDVLCVTDAEGTPIVDYTYDAWGVMTVSPASQNVSSQEVVRVAFLNPVTYRGYFYDYELGLYYLQSRYYDPEMGRFISADIVLDTFAGCTGTNAFLYCESYIIQQKEAEQEKSEIEKERLLQKKSNTTEGQDELNLIRVNYYASGYGHVDLAIDGVIFSYGNYGKVKDSRWNRWTGQAQGYFLYSPVETWYKRNSQRTTFSFKVSEEVKFQILEFYEDFFRKSEFDRIWSDIDEYGNEIILAYVYRINSGKYKNYAFFWRNCVTATISALDLGISDRLKYVSAVTEGSANYYKTIFIPIQFLYFMESYASIYHDTTRSRG